LLQETSELVRVRAEAKGLELFVTVERGIPDRLHGDSARLRQILTNLADNAVKFTSEGRIDLTARLDRRDRDGTLWTRFEVRDTGPGIPEERRDRLFRPFEPSRDPRQDRMRGSGLGLAISAELARLMGGSLELAATTGPGARFQLTLPLHRGQRSRRDTTPVLGLPVLAQASPPRTGRLLVVEDDPVNREVLHSQLALLGLAADEVATGADALALFVPGRYEAALLDCDLPDLDGLELARRMREREGDGPLTPLIAVTASVLRSEPEPWRQSSFDDLLLKPFRVDELATILSAWLDTPIVAPPPAAGGGGSRLGGARRTAAAQDSHRPPEIDFESLESLAALPGTGGDDPAGRMVALFREHAGRDVAWLLAELARTAPSDELGQVAHRLKGSAASAGAVGLSRLAGEIETAAKSGEAEAARESAGALGPAFEAALESLANRLDELRAERGEP
jgi:CheY-like chemotaxis protein